MSSSVRHCPSPWRIAGYPSGQVGTEDAVACVVEHLDANVTREIAAGV
jgi:hypothetical protein